MAKFSAYLDASGTPDQPFVIVAGYIANYMQWRVFESQWKGIHTRYGVELPFHMADFIAATARPETYAKQKHARQDYVQLAKDTEKVGKFFNNICVAQLSVINCALSCSVSMSVYNGVSSLLDLRTIVPPYAVAARTCIHMLREWEKFFQTEPAEYIFEEGDFEQGKFTDLMLDEGWPVPIYKKKKDFAGLQAADQYAWEELYSSKKELQNRTQMEFRNSFKLLLEGIPSIRREVTTEGLIKLCHFKKIDPRTGVKR